MISGFKFWQIYQSLYLHFSSSYDVIKYGTKSKTLTKSSFERRRDKGRFEIFANKLNSTKEALYLCISNFVRNEEGWIYRDYNDSFVVYCEWKAYIESFSYRFKEELFFIEKTKKDNDLSFNDLLKKTPSGKHPPLLQLYFNKKISIECLTLLAQKFDFLNDWINEYENDPYISNELKILTKYFPLIIIIRKGTLHYHE